MAEHASPDPSDTPTRHQAVIVPPEHPTPSEPHAAAPSATRRTASSIPRELPDDTPVEVGAFAAFSFSAGTPLSPDELQTVTLFHEQYLQRPADHWTRKLLQEAKRDAAHVLPLLRRQLEVASQSHEGARGAEAQTVQRNIEWIEREVVAR
jgi:hypothetical protein